MVSAEETPPPSAVDKIRAIQSALRDQKLEGWLFYDFWKRNEFAQRILEIPRHAMNTRRFFYLIPAEGEPRKLVHSIERWILDHLPGEKVIYLSWQSLEEGLKQILAGQKSVAMEYSPGNAIPTISKVDAGTVEMVRRNGVEVVSSMNLAQIFESRWSQEAFYDNLDTAAAMHSIVLKSFMFIADTVRRGERLTEYEVQQFMLGRFRDHGLTSTESPNCSVNANTGNPHYEPTREIHSEIHEGDFVLLDLWAKKEKPGATFNDICWVGYLGRTVPGKYASIFNIVKGARDAAVDFLRKSLAEKRVVRGCDVDDVARGHIVRHGHGDRFIHRTGHSITEDVHGSGANMDNLETRDERIIIPETAFSVEPGIYFIGEYGVRSEINVYISKEHEVIVPGEPRQQEVLALLK